MFFIKTKLIKQKGARYKTELSGAIKKMKPNTNSDGRSMFIRRVYLNQLERAGLNSFVFGSLHENVRVEFFVCDFLVFKTCIKNAYKIFVQLLKIINSFLLLDNIFTLMLNSGKRSK